MPAKGQTKKSGLTAKQRKYVELVKTTTLPKIQCLEKAGYARGSDVFHIENSPAMRNALHAALEKAGATDDYLAQRILEGTNAQEVQFFSFEGKVRDERATPDYSVRQKYLRDIMEMKGYVKNNSIENINIGLISLPPSENQWSTDIQSDAPPSSEQPNVTSTSQPSTEKP